MSKFKKMLVGGGRLNNVMSRFVEVKFIKIKFEGDYGTC